MVAATYSLQVAASFFAARRGAGPALGNTEPSPSPGKEQWRRQGNDKRNDKRNDKGNDKDKETRTVTRTTMGTKTAINEKMTTRKMKRTRK